MKLAAVGLGLTVVVTAILWLGWGRAAVVPGLTFGGLATGIQVAAVAAVKPVWNEAYERFAWRWAMGMGLRLVGVAAIVLAVVLDPNLYPPLPTAFAYLGVLVPLLFAETRFLGDARNSRSA